MLDFLGALRAKVKQAVSKTKSGKSGKSAG
jgi:hypothetical protein